MRNIAKKHFIILLALLLIPIYFSFLFIDFNLKARLSNFSVVLKYSGIIICFTISILIGNDGHSKRDTVLLQLGLFLTAIADLCLLILNHYTFGVLIFCIAQTIYIIRYNMIIKIDKSLIFCSISILSYIAAIVFVKSFIIPFDLLIPIALLYSFLLLSSVYNALMTHKRGFFPKHTCFLLSLGMILFLLCDINVALYNISSFVSNGSLNNTLISFWSSFLIWLFYLPSQALLALSGYKDFKLSKFI